MLTDKQDYEEIYQKYKNLVMKAAYKYSGNYDIAEDITQSTFLQLYMYIDELKDINLLLNKIFRNSCLQNLFFLFHYKVPPSEIISAIRRKL